MIINDNNKTCMTDNHFIDDYIIYESIKNSFQLVFDKGNDDEGYCILNIDELIDCRNHHTSNNTSSHVIYHSIPSYISKMT